MDFIAQLVEAKPFFGALVAGVGGRYFLQMRNEEAIQFGATVALGVSLGDALLSASGVMTKLETYIPSDLGKDLNYIVDPNDLLGGALGVTIVNFSLGMEGRPLLMAGAIGGVAGGVAPRLSTWILGALQGSKKKNGKTETDTARYA